MRVLAGQRCVTLFRGFRAPALRRAWNGAKKGQSMTASGGGPLWLQDALFWLRSGVSPRPPYIKIKNILILLYLSHPSVTGSVEICRSSVAFPAGHSP